MVNTTAVQAVNIGYDGLNSQTTSEHDATSPVKTDMDYVLSAAATPVAASSGAGPINTAVLSDDGHGNIATITAGNNGSTGVPATQCAVRYDPYGTAISNTSAPLASGNSCATGATQNDQFYRSGRRDAMTGAYQLGQRTYSPPQAGFLTPDTYQGPANTPQPSTGTDPLTANTYTYVNGDPINLADPNGHHPICATTFPPEIRKIIYTTNAIESLNYQLRKIIKNRGHFPSDDAAIKLLWLAIRDIEDKRARAREKEAGTPAASPARRPAGSSKAPPPKPGDPPWPP